MDIYRKFDGGGGGRGALYASLDQMNAVAEKHARD